MATLDQIDREFTTTHWSIVLAAGQCDSPDAQQALGKLCRTYWYPLYAFARRQGRSSEDAEDLTQGFFARFLEKGSIGLADPTRGRFRSFLLGSFKNFIAEAHRQASRLKRGGGQSAVSWDAMSAEERYLAEPTDDSTAEALYEERWALTLLETAMARLGAEMAASRTGADLCGAQGTAMGRIWHRVVPRSFRATGHERGGFESDSAPAPPKVP